MAIRIHTLTWITILQYDHKFRSSPLPTNHKCFICRFRRICDAKYIKFSVKGRNHTLAASSGLFFTGAYASQVSITYIEKEQGMRTEQ
jgi:hypothetical protein